MVRVIYSGLDVHKDTINTAFADSSGEVLFENRINHHWPSVKKIFTRIRSQYKGAPIQVCYEAGPTGYGLARELSEYGWDRVQDSCPGEAAPADRPDQDGPPGCHEPCDNAAHRHAYQCTDTLTPRMSPAVSCCAIVNRENRISPGSNRKSRHFF